jgi:ribonuclease P/MRP protein subunit RPP1
MFHDLNILWPVPFVIPKNGTAGGGGKKGKENKGSSGSGQNSKVEGKDILVGRQRDDLRSLTMDAADLGFNIIAYNFIVRSRFEGTMHGNPFAVEQQGDQFNVPFPDLEIRNKKGKQALNAEPTIRQLTRMTLIMDEDSMGKHGHGLTNTNQASLMGYDLLSAQPCNDQSFSTLCLSLTELKPFSIDIITLDFASHSRAPFYMKRSLVNAAIQNGAVFEVCYSRAVSGSNNNGIDDTKARRNIISSTRELIRMTNGKGIIISSGAADLLGLRGPYDVINFASVLGMNSMAAKDAITSTCRSLLLRAETRKTFRGVVGSVEVVMPINKNDESGLSKRKDREDEQIKEKKGIEITTKKKKMKK